MDWVPQAREELFQAGREDRGWGYRRGGKPGIEPTVLANLGLLATEGPSPQDRTINTVKGAAVWLAQQQQKNGALGLAPGQPQPNWPTPYAILLWATQQGFDANIQQAAAWLLQERGTTFEKTGDSVAGHDTTITGWPWVSNTHSWIEPTSVALLGLRCVRQTEHARYTEGLTLIRDRAIATGGWNYGNSSVLGNTLRPHPAPTGLALLALAGTQTDPALIQRATDYLIQSLPQTRAPMSLAWGLLGLSAWNHRPPEADRWLNESFRASADRGDPPYFSALLLLASSPKSLALLAAASDTPAGGEK